MHTHLNTISVEMCGPNGRTDLGGLNILLEYNFPQTLSRDFQKPNYKVHKTTNRSWSLEN